MNWKSWFGNLFGRKVITKDIPRKPRYCPSCFCDSPIYDIRLGSCHFCNYKFKKPAGPIGYDITGDKKPMVIISQPWYGNV